MDLFVYVEGADDERMVNHVIKKCHKQFDPTIIQFSSMRLKDTIESLEKHTLANDLFVVLIDSDRAPSVDALKIEWAARRRIDKNHVAVAVSSIESWYVSGSTSARINRLFEDTPSDRIHKSRFDRVVKPEMGHRRALVMALDGFDTDKAARKSESFAHFYRGLESIARGLPAGPDKGGSRARRRRSP
ncbi:MAG: DUF4276 family protein [Nitrosopumilus sp.]|nr:DUF4276 family protein [Nitrosopumilus sp.]